MRGGRRPRRGATAGGARPERLETLRIEGIAAGGDGVGRADGQVVFVPRTAPGDLVQAAVVSHGRLARGRVLQLLERAPERVDPSCRHYEGDQCGGCQLQHLSAEAQGMARTRLVQEALQRIGGRRIPLPPLVRGEAWGYRGRVTLALRRRGGRWRGGFHPHDAPGRVFEVEACPITDPRLMAAWPAVRGLLAAAHLPEAEALRLSLRLAPDGEGADGVVVVLEGGRQWAMGEAWGDAVLRAVPGALGCWWHPEEGTARCLAERPGARTAAAMAFAQVHAALADRLRAHVAEAVLARAPRRVVDGYAGVGRLAVQLRGAGVGGVAIEADPVGAAAAREALGRVAAPDAAAWRVEAALMEAALPAALPADVVVVNPPRRGVAPEVCAALEGAATRGTRALVYVSCDPATLARDLQRLPGWRIDAVTCFDLFPQTAHVETVCVLQPEGA